MASLLSSYKAQQNVEKGFRFLKRPDFLTSAIYLKKPERIEALLMVMTSCLMVYASLEHHIRKHSKTRRVTSPTRKKAKPNTHCSVGFPVLRKYNGAVSSRTHSAGDELQRTTTHHH